MHPQRKAQLERRIGVLLKGTKKPRFAEEALALPPSMRKALGTFDRFNRQRKLSVATRTNQIDAVADFGLYVAHRRGRARFEEAVGEDFEAYQVDVPMPKSVAQLARTVLRKFYWHLEGEGRGRRKIYPAKVDALEPPQANGNEEFNAEKVPYYREMPKHLETLVRAMDHPRDRAILAFTFDTGARLDEIASLKVGALSLHREYGIVALHGKTGTRDVAFVRALPYLTTWLNMHPSPADRDAPLWVTLGRDQGKTLAYSSVADVFARAARISGLPLSAHDLRHGRATEAAQIGWNESKMRAHFGWSASSIMPSKYVHLASVDVRNQVLQDAGLEAEEKAEPAGMPIPCPNCGHRNEPVNVVCGICRFPLDEKEAGKVHELEAKVKDELKRLVGEEVQRVLRERGG